MKLDHFKEKKDIYFENLNFMLKLIRNDPKIPEILEMTRIFQKLTKLSRNDQQNLTI